MRIVVKLFGPQAQLAGGREISVELPDELATCATMRAHLAKTQPRLAPTLASSRLAVNHEFAEANRRIEAGDEVALIAMVSGG